VGFEPTSGRLSGEIVVDAQSGQSGNLMRRPENAQRNTGGGALPRYFIPAQPRGGTVAAQGKSSVQVQGVFTVHGTNHELTAPAEVEMTPEGWSATIHFAIPYVKWGLKNPSTLFLCVSESVEIDLIAAGSVVKP